MFSLTCIYTTYIHTYIYLVYTDTYTRVYILIAPALSFSRSETPSPGTPMSKEVFELDYENDFKITKSMNNLLSASSSPISLVVAAAADSKDKDKEKSKVSKRPKPMLSLQLSDADSALQSGLIPPQTGTYIHTYVHTYIHSYKHAYIHTFVQTCIHSFIHTYIQYILCIKVYLIFAFSVVHFET